MPAARDRTCSVHGCVDFASLYLEDSDSMSDFEDIGKVKTGR